MSRTVLFQGDSITDCGRDRNNPNDTGRGYVHLLACRLEHDQAESPLTVLNRGISGNRTRDLLARWQEDALDLKPNLLSLFIGINNTWRRYDQQDPTPAEVFEQELNRILTQTFEATDCVAEHSILMEPFVLDVPAGDKQHWMEDLAPKQDIVRSAARTFGMRHLPLQSVFNQACSRAPGEYWAHDGVHPTRAGHQLIADAWMDKMKDLL